MQRDECGRGIERSAHGRKLPTVSDQVLTVTYKQGDKAEQKKITVTPQTIIATTVPGNKDDLKPGAQFIVFRATKNADGTLAAEAIAVGRGIAPPM